MDKYKKFSIVMLNKAKYTYNCVIAKTLQEVAKEISSNSGFYYNGKWRCYHTIDYIEPIE